jgi:hypothetical protein
MAVITLSVVVLTPTKAFGLGLPPLPSLAAGILFITIPAISCNFWISFSMDPTYSLHSIVLFPYDNDEITMPPDERIRHFYPGPFLCFTFSIRLTMFPIFQGALLLLLPCTLVFFYNVHGIVAT